MIGFYGIHEITDPKQLTVKLSDVPYYSDKELSVGMKPLCYGMKKTILLSFVYNSKIYYIVSDQDGTHVAELNNNFLKKVQFLTNKKLLTYFEETRKTKDEHSVALLKVPPLEGYIDVFQNKIQIILYK